MSSDYKQMYSVSWEQLHRDARTLALRLLNEGQFYKGIIAITRGGMVPAAIIARELDIRLIDTACLSSYDWQEKKGEVEVLKGFTGDGKGEGWLMIDDLVDTGRTASIIRKLIPKAHFATIYAKPAGKPLVDSYVTEVSQNTWILFPWDAQVQFVEPLVGGRKKD